jgi:hypothetical protein
MVEECRVVSALHQINNQIGDRNLFTSDFKKIFDKHQYKLL